MEFIKNWWFLIMMLSIASVLVFVWLFVFNKEKLRASWWEILIVTLIHTGYGVLTVKFFALLEAGFNFEKAGNMSLFGGIFLMPIMYFVYAKIKGLPLSIVFDVFSIPLAGTLALARINCFYAGCCQGIELNNGFKWPAREIDLTIHILFLVFVSPWVLAGKSKGRAYSIYMIVYGVGRFGNEWLRTSSVVINDSFHLSHIWAIVSFSIGLFLTFYINWKQKKGAIEDDNI